MKQRVRRFRLWDGKQMHHDGAFEFSQFPVGLLIPENKGRFFPFDGIESGEMVCGDVVDAKEGVLMESTGAIDKNNVEAFEGDVVCLDTDPSMKFVIQFRNSMFGFENANGIFICIGLPWLPNFLIVCNIFENPELINKNQII